LTASEAGLALIPLAAISTCGAAIAGRTMARAKHYKRVAIVGTSWAALCGLGLTLTTLPLWALLTLMAAFALGLGTTFPVCVVSVQNSVSRPQVGTITGALNFFRSLMSSFTVAAFAAILLIALGADIPLAGEHHVAGSVAIPADDMRHAFRYVFGAATALMTGAALCLIMMEERPLAGPTVAQQVEMAE
jgi:MFS family permease